MRDLLSLGRRRHWEWMPLTDHMQRGCCHPRTLAQAVQQGVLQALPLQLVMASIALKPAQSLHGTNLLAPTLRWKLKVRL